MLVKIWTNAPQKNIVNGFRKGGIIPFDREVIKPEQYDPEAYKRWQLHSEKRTQGSVNINDGPVITAAHDEQTINSHETASTSVDNKAKNENENCIASGSNKANFEEILLKRVKSKTTTEKFKRTRVSKGAELLTLSDTILRLEEIKQNKMKPKKVKTKEDKKITKNPSTSKKIDYSSDDSDALDMSLHDSESDYDCLEDMVTENEELNKIEHYVEKLRVGNWVLVAFATKKTKKHYVGQILEIDKNELKIKFVRKKEGEKTLSFIWPEQEDECEVSEDEVIMVLPEPNLGRRADLSFNIRFDSYNIQ